MTHKTISNWGNYPRVKKNMLDFASESDLREKIAAVDGVIPRGMGRSYGDASLGTTMLSTLEYNQVLDFDKEKGVLNCESGVTLDRILELVIPLGWFLSVTPGTKFVSVGGAVASDVHGKNHHKEGALSAFVLSFTMMLETGEVVTCSENEHTDLFEATLGGMGLTGVILTVRLKLKPIETSFIYQEITPCNNLEELILEIDKRRTSTYSVAWFDCLSKSDIGKGILITGEHATSDQLESKLRESPLVVSEKRSRRIPFYFPSFLLNKMSIRLFNRFYFYMKSKGKGFSITGYDDFFYPLDGIKDWNKIYGRKGFVQYQMVIPMKHGKKGLQELLSVIRDGGYGSFLAVLKLMGPRYGTIAFPEAGYTLALDFPVNENVFSLIKRLDKIVQRYEGRIYLAKDSRVEAHTFAKMYGNLSKFQEVCRKYNPKAKFRSMMSNRLNLLR